MDGQSEKRMADNYEITQSVWIGDKEVVMGVDMTNAMPYFCAYYTSNEIYSSYDGGMISDNYLEMVELFAERVSGQCQKLREEQERITVSKKPITADMCQQVASDASMVGKVMAIRADALRPEYRLAPYQLVLVTGGNGARANARGRACFCKILYDGEGQKCVRSDFYGEVKPEHLPDWAKERVDLCQRAMEEVEYLQQWEQKRDAESRYRILATVKYEGNTAVVQFPTKELGSTLESIGVTLPPERVYLGAMRDVEVQFQHEGNHVVDALIHLFKDNNSLRMVNEVAKAVFHSDWRVYERVEEKLKTDSYSDVENLLRDAVDYSKYLKDKERHGRGDR